MKLKHFKTSALALAVSLVLSGFVNQNSLGMPVQLLEQQEKTQEQVDAERFKEADTSGDGAISREEFRTYISSKLQNFDMIDEFMNRLDSSQDNKITPDEFKSRREVLTKIVDEAEAKARANQPKEFQDIFNARFLPNDPKVGSTVPEELTALDERGKKLSFKDLRGKYTVINFGCLT